MGVGYSNDSYFIILKFIKFYLINIRSLLQDAYNVELECNFVKVVGSGLPRPTTRVDPLT